MSLTTHFLSMCCSRCQGTQVGKIWERKTGKTHLCCPTCGDVWRPNPLEYALLDMMGPLDPEDQLFESDPRWTGRQIL